MKQLVPSQSTSVSGEVFPIEGGRATQYSQILCMELFGCSLAQVSHEMSLSKEEIEDICNNEDYQYIKNVMMSNLRKLDQATLSGRIAKEASEAFERMTELSKEAKKEDVRLEANKDILDRALLTNSQVGECDELRITLVKRRKQ